MNHRPRKRFGQDLSAALIPHVTQSVICLRNMIAATFADSCKIPDPAADHHYQYRHLAVLQWLVAAYWRWQYRSRNNIGVTSARYLLAPLLTYARLVGNHFIPCVISKRLQLQRDLYPPRHHANAIHHECRECRCLTAHHRGRFFSTDPCGDRKAVAPRIHQRGTADIMRIEKIRPLMRNAKCCLVKHTD